MNEMTNDAYGPILWVICKGPIQFNGNMHCCMYKGLILYGDTMNVTMNPIACTEDQSYGTVQVATCTVLRGSSMSSMKDQLYGNSTCTKSGCQKEYLYRGDVQRQYTESQYITSVACRNMHNSSLINGTECMCMSQCLWVCVPMCELKIV